MTDILICGINGKMGREVYSLASQSTAFNVVCGVDKHTFGNFDCPVYTSLAEVNAHFDAIIDFSSPYRSRRSARGGKGVRVRPAHMHNRALSRSA